MDKFSRIHQDVHGIIYGATLGKVILLCWGGIPMRSISGFVAAFLVVSAMVSCSSDSSPLEQGLSEPPGSLLHPGSTAHNLFGLFTFICDPESATLEIIPLRDAGIHLNALTLLEPPPGQFLSIESPLQINGNILDVDIGIRNPFIGEDQHSGFDVCGIVITHGSLTGFTDPAIVTAGDGDTRLLNADGYTRWWNPHEFPHGDTVFNYIDGLLGTPAVDADFNCTINGYKYFADGLEKNDPPTAIDPGLRGISLAGQQNTRHYTIDMSGGWIFNYAIDACWKYIPHGPPYTVPADFPPGANRPEAYFISVTELENSMYFDTGLDCGGGQLKLLIDVWDHFNPDLNGIYAESLAGIPQTSTLTPVGGDVGFSTYRLDLYGEDLFQGGDAELLIEVRSEVSGYGAVLPDVPVSSYFTHPFSISAEGPKGWARSWGEIGSDAAQGVAVDGSGNIYTTGYVSGGQGIDLDPGPGVDWHEVSGLTGFLSKFDPCGNYEWGKTWFHQGDGIGIWSYGVGLNDSGDVYVTGSFVNTVDFDPGPGIDEHTSIGYQDAFLGKYDADGNFKWARTWGGENACPFPADSGITVAVDAYGNAYVYGAFCETVDFDPGPGIAEYTSVENDENTFLSKFSPDGNFQWVRTWDTDLWESYGTMMTLNQNGIIYLTGSFYETVDFDPGPGLDERVSAGNRDIFVTSVDSDGNYTGSITLGGPGNDEGSGIAIDDHGDIYVTGVYGQTVDFDPGPDVDEHTSNHKQDVFLCKFNSTGGFLWARTWGGDNPGLVGNDRAEGIAVDKNSNVFVTGHFQSTVDFDPGPGVDERSEGGPFVSKFNSTGDFLWVTTWGDEKRFWTCEIAADIYSNIYIVGELGDLTDFDPGPGTDYHHPFMQDAFLYKSSPDGTW